MLIDSTSPFFLPSAALFSPSLVFQLLLHQITPHLHHDGPDPLVTWSGPYSKVTIRGLSLYPHLYGVDSRPADQERGSKSQIHRKQVKVSVCGIATEALMRYRHAHSDERCSGAAARQAGGVATRLSLELHPHHLHAPSPTPRISTKPCKNIDISLVKPTQSSNPFRMPRAPDPEPAYTSSSPVHPSTKSRNHCPGSCSCPAPALSPF